MNTERIAEQIEQVDRDLAEIDEQMEMGEIDDATAERLSEAGECISIPGDLSTVDGVKALADAIKERESQLDILVNNAGAAWESRSRTTLKVAGTRSWTLTSSRRFS